MIPAFILMLQAQSQLQGLLRNGSSDPVVIATALGVAFFLGAAHALTPGHGKALVAAYLVGSKGRVWDAVYLGSVVTVTHTAAVFVLGVLTLYASQRISVDRVYPWMGLASGILVAGLGVWLFWRRFSAYRSGESHHHHHHHPHDGHTHHTHDGGELSHSHANGDHHHDTHHHHHQHELKGSLLSLGISGGMVPCPEALVVLLVSISLNRVLFGLAVLALFSFGLAAVLIGIGATMVLAAPLVQRVGCDGPWIRRLPVISAGVVSVLGFAILVQAARQI